MRVVRQLLVAIAVVAISASGPTAVAARFNGGEAAGPVMVTESPAAGPAGDCGCRGGQPQQAWQQPPWHGNVRGYQCGAPQACCRGSSVFQAHPFQQLQWKHSGCVTLPPCLPRLHGFCRDGVMPSPIPPALPRCHQCGAAIEGGF